MADGFKRYLNLQNYARNFSQKAIYFFPIFSHNFFRMKTFFNAAVMACLLVFAGCTKNNPPPLPIQPAAKASVITGQVTNITAVSASFSGEVDYEGTSAITEAGVCWDVNPNPTTLRPHSSAGAGTGTYTLSIYNLDPNTTYHVRAYVTSMNGTSYGEEVTFKTKAAWANINNAITNYNINNVVSCGGALFASQSSQPYVLKSADNGVDWSGASTGINVPGTLYNPYLFAFGNDLYLTGYASPVSVIYKSSDNGSTWTSVPWPYNNPIDFLMKQGSTLFATVSYDGVYKTSDDGANWTTASTGLPNNGNFYSAESFNSGLFLSLQGDCYRSTDNGTSWSQANSGLPASSIYGFCKSGNSLFAATSSNGLYTSSNNGDNWTQTGTGLGNTVYQVIDAGSSMFAQSPNGTYISQDTGSNWSQLNVGLPNNSSGLLIYHGSAVYLLRSDGLWKYPL